MTRYARVYQRPHDVICDYERDGVRWCKILHLTSYRVRCERCSAYHPRKTYSWQKITENKVCVLIFFTALSEIFLILRRIKRDIIITILRSSCIVPVIIVRFQWSLNSLDGYSKRSSNTKFNKNPYSGSRLVPFRQTEEWTDGRTDTNY
jgi:hypothetical protein